jgi:hypothetical protein
MGCKICISNLKVLQLSTDFKGCFVPGSFKCLDVKEQKCKITKPQFVFQRTAAYVLC